MLKRIGKLLGFRPYLSYLEIHLADHCNLNCKGCGHFSPIAEKRFADLNSFERDMKQLQRLFSTIHKVVLMGGEPLLNPHIDSFITATKASFPKSDILVYTNGILLPQMPEKFWSTCRSCSVGIAITIYPPLKKKESALIQLVKANGLRVFVHSVTSFHAFYNRKGDTDPLTGFKRCRNRWYTPMLREGKIYICPKAATMLYFNKKFGLNVPRTGFVDIFAPGLNGWDVKDELNKASTTCCHCTLGWTVVPVFPWATSKHVLQDWTALTSQA